MELAEERIAEVLERLHFVEGEPSLVADELAEEKSELVRIAPGVYFRISTEWQPWRLAEMVALGRVVWAHQRNPEAVMVLESAALLHGLPLPEQSLDVHLSNIGSGNTRRTNLPNIVRLAGARGGNVWNNALHRYTHNVPEADVVEIHGIRVCSLERLIVDLARLRPARFSIVPIDAACARITSGSKFDRERTQKQMAILRERLRHRITKMRGARGVVRAREVIEWADALSESPGESLVRWMVGAIGLPQPVTQKKVVTSEGRQYYLDIWIEEFKLAIEFDGARKYDGPDGQDQVWKDKRRDDNLQIEGIRVIHVVWADVANARAIWNILIRIFGSAALVEARPRRHLIAGSGLTATVAA